MFVTIINDCKDDNAMGRQATRAASLFKWPVNTVGVDSDLEAAGNLIDMLDASEGGEGVILVNVAPRHKDAKKWPNGTPFGYFFYKETLVVSSIDGLTLSLVKKLKLTDHIRVLDIPTVLKKLYEQGVISSELVDYVTHTQFRSFEFVPRVAKWISEGLDVPYEKYTIDSIKEAPNAVWWIDNFGNCKTTLLKEELQFEHGQTAKTLFGELNCYDRLKDVPDHESALIVGSSGLNKQRFVEIVTQGESAAKKLQIKSSDPVL